MTRRAELRRHTQETQVSVVLELDGDGRADIETGIGFLDHMLTLFARHGRFDLTVRAQGDRHVDDHHTAEDVGIVIGQALREALGDKQGINRYGYAYVPMDEALVRAVVDLSGRPYCVYDVPLHTARIGTFDTELADHFWRSLAFNALASVHIDLIRGTNTHHILEAVFKGMGVALREASRVTHSGIPSTKGTL